MSLPWVGSVEPWLIQTFETLSTSPSLVRLSSRPATTRMSCFATALAQCAAVATAVELTITAPQNWLPPPSVRYTAYGWSEREALSPPTIRGWLAEAGSADAVPTTTGTATAATARSAPLASSRDRRDFTDMGRSPLQKTARDEALGTRTTPVRERAALNT